MNVVDWAERIAEYERKQRELEIERYVKHIGSIRDAVDVAQITVTEITGKSNGDGFTFMASGFVEPRVTITRTARPAWAEVTFEKVLVWPGCTINPGEQALVIMPPDDVYVAVPAERAAWEKTALAGFLWDCGKL